MPKTAVIRAISFDGDNTLWDFDAGMRHALGLTLDELRSNSPAAADNLTVDRMIEIRNRVAQEQKGRTTNLEQIRLEAFRETLRAINRPDNELAACLNAFYLKRRFEGTRLFDDALPTLQVLKQHFAIGLLSNGNSHPKRLSLEGMFQFVVFSQDQGVEKPDKRIFQITADQAGCSLEKLLHVGDSLPEDYQGAKQAGCQGIWLNRGGKMPTPDIPSRDEISSLSELPALVEISKP